MSNNQLKIIACLSMLIDHIGYLLFPDLVVLRCIGRIAMPLFSYLIAEGCKYTRSKRKYFTNVFSLAVICQLFYLGEQLYSGGITQIYLNILFTFSLSIPLCCSYLSLKESVMEKSKQGILIYSLLFSASIALSIFCCFGLSDLLGIYTQFDYGISGVFLPLFAVVFNDKKFRIPMFAVGLIVFNLLLFQDVSYIWFSLLAVPIVAFYNGERGKLRLKYLFYIFYPLHLGLIYLVQMIAF